MNHNDSAVFLDVVGGNLNTVLEKLGLNYDLPGPSIIVYVPGKQPLILELVNADHQNEYLWQFYHLVSRFLVGKSFTVFLPRGTPLEMRLWLDRLGGVAAYLEDFGAS